MSMNYEIPEHEVENVLHVYWMMLAEIESNTDPKKDILNRILVESAYKVLHRSGVLKESVKPRWEQNV